MAIKYVLLDIEGTVSPINFVHKVLFPYSHRRLREFVKAHAGEAEVQACLAATRDTVAAETGRQLDADGATEQLLDWITADRKHPALKKLQGMIWREGYEGGVFTSELYPDVKPQLQAWRERGLRLGIYSSGSVEAQKLLFKYTAAGDLTPLLSDYFDTAVGGKREPSAYATILQEVKLPAASVLFASDIPEELVAARACGLQTVHILRPGTTPASGERAAADLFAVEQLLL